MHCVDIQREILDRDWDNSALDSASAIMEHLQQEVIDFGWDWAGWNKAVEVSAHVKECPECEKALLHFDHLRHLLRMPEAPGDHRHVLLSPSVASEEENSTGHSEQFASTYRAGWGNILAGRNVAALVLTASVVLAVAGWGMYFFYSAVNQNSTGHAPSIASQSPTNEKPSAGLDARLRLTTKDVARGMSIFSNVSEAFGGRVSWVAVDNHNADLGLMSADGKQNDAVLLRLVVSSDDRDVSSTDVVIIPGKEASIDVPFESGQVLHYTIMVSPDANRQLSIWTELRTPGEGSSTLAALATTLKLTPHRVLKAGRMVTASGNYGVDVLFAEKETS